MPLQVGVTDQTPGAASSVAEVHTEAGPQTAAGTTVNQQVVRGEANLGVFAEVLARLTEIRDELRYHRALLASREAFDLPGYMPDLDGTGDMSDARADAPE